MPGIANRDAIPICDKFAPVEYPHALFLVVKFGKKTCGSFTVPSPVDMGDGLLLKLL